jgi:hypothetical protein
MINDGGITWNYTAQVLVSFPYSSTVVLGSWREVMDEGFASKLK